jgi:biofilm PGA synthesis protein PgaA
MFSKDTPLRALLYGITANSGEISIGYDWSESTAMNLTVRMLDFSDGNQREEAYLSFAQRLIDVPHFDLTLRPSIGASTNSLSTAKYFNPEQDFSAMVAFDAEHVIWRSYERSFEQRLIPSIGNYWQENFGNDWVGSITYEQVLKHDRYGELRYGVEVGRNSYDGDPTGVVLCFINLNLRF